MSNTRKRKRAFQIWPSPFPYKSTRNASNWSMEELCVYNLAQKYEKFKLVKCSAQSGCGRVMLNRNYLEHKKKVHKDEYTEDATLHCLKLDPFNKCWEMDVIGKTVKQDTKQTTLNFAPIKKKQRLSITTSTATKINSISLHPSPLPSAPAPTFTYDKNDEIDIDLDEDSEYEELPDDYEFPDDNHNHNSIVAGHESLLNEEISDNDDSEYSEDSDIDGNVHTINGLRCKFGEYGMDYEQMDDDASKHMVRSYCDECGHFICNGEWMDFSKINVRKNIYNQSKNHIESHKHAENEMNINDSKYEKGLNILCGLFLLLISNIIGYVGDNNWSKQIYNKVYNDPHHKYVDWGNKYHSKYILPQFKKVIFDQVKDLYPMNCDCFTQI